MTILEIMERTNSRDTKMVTAFVKDAIMKIQSSTDMSTKVNKQNITKSLDGDDNQYDLPVDMVYRSKSKKRSNDGGSKAIPVYSTGDRGKYLYDVTIAVNDKSL